MKRNVFQIRNVRYLVLVGALTAGLFVQHPVRTNAQSAAKIVNLRVGASFGDLMNVIDPLQFSLNCDTSATMFGFALTAEARRSAQVEPFWIFPGYAPYVLPIDLVDRSQCRLFVSPRNDFTGPQMDVSINGSAVPLLVKDRNPYVDFVLSSDTSIDVVVKNGQKRDPAIIEGEAIRMLDMRVDSGEGPVYRIEKQPTCDGKASAASGFRTVLPPKEFWVNYVASPSTLCTVNLVSSVPDFVSRLVVYVNGAMVTPTVTSDGVSVAVPMIGLEVRMHAILRSATPVAPVVTVSTTTTAAPKSVSNTLANSDATNPSNKSSTSVAPNKKMTPGKKKKRAGVDGCVTVVKKRGKLKAVAQIC